MEENKIENQQQPEEQILESVFDGAEYTMISPDETFVWGAPEQKSKLFAAFGEYLSEVKNPPRSSVNTYLKNANGEPYHYSNLGDVLSATRPVLSKYGLSVTQVPRNRDGEVSVQTLLMHRDGGLMVFPGFSVKSGKTDAQSIVATVTYARRCALNAILSVYGEDDTDGQDTGGDEKKPAKKTESLASMKSEVVNACTAAINSGIERAAVCAIIQKECGSENPMHLGSVAACKNVLKAIKEMAKKEEQN